MSAIHSACAVCGANKTSIVPDEAVVCGFGPQIPYICDNCAKSHAVYYEDSSNRYYVAPRKR